MSTARGANPWRPTASQPVSPLARAARRLAWRSPTTRRNNMRELLDGAALPADELEGNLAEIRLINRGLGWTSATIRVLAALQGPGFFSYLDVATGSADLPVALLRRARKYKWTIEAHALDGSAEVLAIARRQVGDAPIAMHAGDARALPFADRSFDVVTCALALHHFQPDQAVVVLRELARVARSAWVVVDLERSLPAYLGALVLRIVLRNRLTRHDAPASVLRAYTLPEFRSLLEDAGLSNALCTRRFPFRLVAYGAPDAAVTQAATASRACSPGGAADLHSRRPAAAERRR